jgi:hypothetical protein
VAAPVGAREPEPDRAEDEHRGDEER